MADQICKNIHVFKGLSVDDFMETMGVMTAALQFDCSDCHANAGTDRVDWAADTPRKRTARRMVTMMQTINKDNFAGAKWSPAGRATATATGPLVTSTMETIYSMPSLESDDVVFTPLGSPTPQSILDKFIEASGGAQKLASLTSFVARGTSVGFGGFGGGDVEIDASSPTSAPPLSC